MQKLREDDRHAPVRRRVADPVLAVELGRRLDHPLVALAVVARPRPHLLHVGAVRGLAHREAARQLELGDVAQVGVVVALGAEVEDGAAEEPELHAALDEQREVAEGERLEGRDRAADVAAASVLAREAERGLPIGRELLRPLHDLLPVLVAADLGIHGGELGPREHLAAARANLALGLVQVVAEGRRVDALELRGLVLGRLGGVGHQCLLRLDCPLAVQSIPGNCACRGTPVAANLYAAAQYEAC